MAKGDFDQIVGEMSSAMGKLWQWQFGDFSAGDCWSPDVNVYKLARRIEVCVDLAGINKRSLEIRVEPGKLIIRGFRAAPEPPEAKGESMRILCMEIDHGPFTRVIPLPDQIVLAKIESTYELGWLWVRMPLREPG